MAWLAQPAERCRGWTAPARARGWGQAPRSCLRLSSSGSPSTPGWWSEGGAVARDWHNATPAREGGALGTDWRSYAEQQRTRTSGGGTDLNWLAARVGPHERSAHASVRTGCARARRQRDVQYSKRNTRPAMLNTSPLARYVAPEMFLLFSLVTLTSDRLVNHTCTQRGRAKVSLDGQPHADATPYTQTAATQRRAVHTRHLRTRPSSMESREWRRDTWGNCTRISHSLVLCGHTRTAATVPSTRTSTGAVSCAACAEVVAWGCRARAGGWGVAVCA